ncbi:MAG: methyl-accepting chemotaxis protein, partial [Planctomycetota bacterium]|nr:methyl-accepting chemotaxis protein [Planctomycetota bacterium]
MKDVKGRIQRSLLAKMLVGGLGTVLLIGLAWHFVGGMLRSEEAESVVMRQTTLEADIAMLQVRRAEKDTLLRDVTSPAFYKTGKGKYLGKHEKALKNLYAKLSQLGQWKDELGRRVSDLEKHTNAYAGSFAKLMEARRTLGYASFGLIGKLRKSEQQLVDLVAESGSPKLVETVHEIERTATEYLLFEQDAVGRELSAQVETALLMLRADKETAGAAEALGLLEGYGRDLTAVLDLRTEIGLREDAGLRGTMRGAIHSLAPLMEETLDVATTLEAEAHSAQDRASIFLLLAGLIGGGLVFVFYARSITRPVGRLRDAAHRLGTGDLEAEVEVQASDELGELAEAFTAMATNLRTAEEDRGRVFAGITETTSRLAAASSEILAATTQQSTGSEEQAAAVSQTVATIDEVLHAAEEGAARATEVTDASKQSVENSRAGAQSVEATIERMRRVKDRSEELSA